MLVDTNIFLRAARAPYPWMREVDRLVESAIIRVPSTVFDELDALAREHVPGAPTARALAQRHRAVTSPGSGDAAILSAARRLHAIVLTADRELQRRSRAAGLSVLVPRDQQRLELLGGTPTIVRRHGTPVSIMNRERLVRPDSR